MLNRNLFQAAARISPNVTTRESLAGLGMSAPPLPAIL